MSYRMPKLKAVQMEGKVDTNINITIMRFGPDGDVQREVPAVDVSSEVVSDKLKEKETS